MLDKLNHSVVDNDLLNEHETERTQLRAQLAKFLAWNTKWPKSAATYTKMAELAQSELELDDLMMETAEMLK